MLVLIICVSNQRGKIQFVIVTICINSKHLNRFACKAYNCQRQIFKTGKDALRIQMPQKRNKYVISQMLLIKWKTEATLLRLLLCPWASPNLDTSLRFKCSLIACKPSNFISYWIIKNIHAASATVFLKRMICFLFRDFFFLPQKQTFTLHLCVHGENGNEDVSTTNSVKLIALLSAISTNCPCTNGIHVELNENKS